MSPPEYVRRWRWRCGAKTSLSKNKAGMQYECEYSCLSNEAHKPNEVVSR